LAILEILFVMVTVKVIPLYILLICQIKILTLKKCYSHFKIFSYIDRLANFFKQQS